MIDSPKSQEQPSGSVNFKQLKKKILVDVFPLTTIIKTAVEKKKTQLDINISLEKEKLIACTEQIENRKKNQIDSLNVDKLSVSLVSEFKNKIEKEAELNKKNVSMQTKKNILMFSESKDKLDKVFKTLVLERDKLNKGTSYFFGRRLSRYQKSNQLFDPLMNLLSSTNDTDLNELSATIKNYKEKTKKIIEELNEVAFYSLVAETIGIGFYYLGLLIGSAAILCLTGPLFLGVLIYAANIMMLGTLFFMMEICEEGSFMALIMNTMSAGFKPASILSAAAVIPLLISGVILSITGLLDNSKAIEESEAAELNHLPAL
jgi:hypothetical protein